MHPQQFILTSSLFFGGKFIFLSGDFIVSVTFTETLSAGD
jgi:hypothetical protein